MSATSIQDEMVYAAAPALTAPDENARHGPGVVASDEVGAAQFGTT